MYIQEILNFVAIIILIIYLQFFRRNQRIMDLLCDAKDISVSDYTVLVSNIPKDYESENYDYDDGLKNYFENLKMNG
jgi:hypothetical protein